MEKKIERVPYISKWYKEEQKDELLHFAFDEQGMTEETSKELNNCFKNTHIYFDKGAWSSSTITTTTTVNPKINDNSDYHYHKPISPTLKFVCHLTKEDVDNIDSYIKDIYHKVGDCQRTKTLYRINEIGDLTYAIQKYIENIDGIRDKKQRQQLERLEKQSKPKKSYEGTLGEHWKELMLLFEIKEKQGLGVVKNMYNNGVLAITTDCKTALKLSKLIDTLGGDFIKDFVKACEKCED